MPSLGRKKTSLLVPMSLPTPSETQNEYVPNVHMPKDPASGLLGEWANSSALVALSPYLKQKTIICKYQTYGVAIDFPVYASAWWRSGGEDPKS